jgi:signal transduction histidine kinase
MEQDNRKEKILVVDDTAATIDMVKTALEGEGYEVIVAITGEKALKRCRLSAPDLILLDVLMPGMDGFETCRRLKADEKTREIPVIFMTALTATESKVAGFEAGGVDYVTKPIEIQEVLARVRTHLTLCSMHRRLEAQNEQLHQEIAKRKRAEDHIHALTHELIKSQENERRKISYELHERVAQDLSSLIITCDALFGKQPQVPQDTQQRVREFSKTLKATIEAIRNLSYDLRPPGLDLLGLAQTVSYYCRDFSQKTRLIVNFTSTGMEDIRLDFDTEINLYRLVQEGLNNIKKHADANQATIELAASFPNIILRLEDDGKGFDVKDRLIATQDEKKMGLKSMEQRVKLLGGKMEIQSGPEKGTKIIIEVPFREKESGSKETEMISEVP